MLYINYCTSWFNITIYFLSIAWIMDTVPNPLPLYCMAFTISWSTGRKHYEDATRLSRTCGVVQCLLCIWCIYCPALYPTIGHILIPRQASQTTRSTCTPCCCDFSFVAGGIGVAGWLLLIFPRKLKWQWKNSHLKMHLLLKWWFPIVMLIFGG